MIWPWAVAGAAALFLLFVVFMWRVGRRAGSPADARKAFPLQRERLEAEFFRAAAQSGKPRGLRWKNCDWVSGVEFARDRKTGQTVALVGVNVSFEAVAGGDMEGVAAVGNLRNASALFVYQDGRWHATAKTVFNLNPDEALDRMPDRFERIKPADIP